MSHDFNFWAVMVGSVLTYAIVIATLVWIYRNSKKNRGEK